MHMQPLRNAFPDKEQPILSQFPNSGSFLHHRVGDGVKAKDLAENRFGGE